MSDTYRRVKYGEQSAVHVRKRPVVNTNLCTDANGSSRRRIGRNPRNTNRTRKTQHGVAELRNTFGIASPEVGRERRSPHQFAGAGLIWRTRIRTPRPITTPELQMRLRGSFFSNMESRTCGLLVVPTVGSTWNIASHGSNRANWLPGLPKRMCMHFRSYKI